MQVTTTVDEHDGICDAHCSLRDAVSSANREPGAYLILLPAGRYVLSLLADFGELGIRCDADANRNGDLDISDAPSIRGAGIFNGGRAADRTPAAMLVAKASQ